MHAGGVGRVLDGLRRSAAGDAALVAGYVADRDDEAFAELVRRHGPKVLGVCRRVLRNEADAHDAFQATFLVLVRKAGDLRQPERVANWLYGVARHVATRAKTAADRRARRAGGVSPLSAVAAQGGDAPRSAEVSELAAALDGELARLPDVYRLAIVMCDLEGRTIREAAASLGWPVGTVSTRLTRGRARLAKRLIVRGLAPAAVLPVGLVTATVRAAGSAGAFPAAETLANGVLRAMLINRLKLGFVAVLAAGAVLAGVGHLARPARADRPAVATVTAKPTPVADPQAALVKQLEGIRWYVHGFSVEQSVITVGDTPLGMDGGMEIGGAYRIINTMSPLTMSNLSVEPGASVTVRRKAAKLRDIRIGSEVTLKFDARKFALTALDSTPDVRDFGLVLKAVDPAKGTIAVALANADAPTELTLSPKAAVYLDDQLGVRRRADLADLTVGMQVQVVTAVENGRLTVTDIRARK